MKGDVAQINDWLDAVEADRRLTANSVFKVAWQLTRKLNEKEFAKSGKLITWQGIKTLAAATGLSARMVRYAVRQLEASGHLAIKAGHGDGQSNCYTLIEQKWQPVAAYNSGNSGNPLPHSGEQKRQSGVSKAATHCAESGNPLPPNSLKNSFYNSSAPNSDTEPGGPRSRADGPLGPLDAEALRRRIGDDHFNAWLSKVSFVSLTAGTLTLAVPNRLFAREIPNRFERPLLENAPGAKRLVVEIAEAQPAKAVRS